MKTSFSSRPDGARHGPRGQTSRRPRRLSTLDPPRLGRTRVRSAARTASTRFDPCGSAARRRAPPPPPRRRRRGPARHPRLVPKGREGQGEEPRGCARARMGTTSLRLACFRKNTARRGALYGRGEAAGAVPGRAPGSNASRPPDAGPRGRRSARCTPRGGRAGPGWSCPRRTRRRRAPLPPRDAPRRRGRKRRPRRTRRCWKSTSSRGNPRAIARLPLWGASARRGCRGAGPRRSARPL